MATDIVKIRRYADDLKNQITEKKTELNQLGNELEETNNLLKSLDAHLKRIESGKLAKPKKKNNLERVIAVIKAGPKTGYKTPDLKHKFSSEYGESIKETTLRSTLTNLRLQGCIDRVDQRWVYRKPYEDE